MDKNTGKSTGKKITSTVDSHADSHADAAKNPAAYKVGDKVIVKSFSFNDPTSYITNIQKASLQVKFTERLAVSRINTHVTSQLIEQIRKHKLKFVVFSADWCKDCWQVIPVLSKIYQFAKFPIRVLGGIKVNINTPPQWHSPPSPPEINFLEVEKIPAIIILDQKSIEIARIYEQPPPGKTLEQHLLKTIKEAIPEENP
ncbi:MAG: TlpA family protein disulfide reductase [Promethearchaeota archaeon]